MAVPKIQGFQIYNQSKKREGTETKDCCYIESELNRQSVIPGFSNIIQSNFQIKTASDFLKEPNSAMTLCTSN